MTEPGDKAGQTLDIREIERLLPHRYPFLLIDRVIGLDEAQVIAIKNVTINEPYFAGHFPGHPVMPGVLIVEAMAQAGAIMAIKSSGFDPDQQAIYFMALDKVKFRKPVVPGDQLRLFVSPLRKGGAIWKMKGRAQVGDDVVCEAEFLASIVPRGGDAGGDARAAGATATGGGAE